MKLHFYLKGKFTVLQPGQQTVQFTGPGRSTCCILCLWRRKWCHSDIIRWCLNQLLVIVLSALTCAVCWVLFSPPNIKGCNTGLYPRTTTFSVFVNKLCDNLENAAFHFYADDTVIYCSSPSALQTLETLQPAAFDVVQSHLTHLKLVLNHWSKFMLFSNGKKNYHQSFLRS